MAKELVALACVSTFCILNYYYYKVVPDGQMAVASTSVILGAALQTAVIIAFLKD